MPSPTFSTNEPELANTTTDGFQSLNNVFVTPDGGYEVVWSTAAGTPGNVTTQWFSQRYDGSGMKIGGEMALAAPPNAPPVSEGQHIVNLTDGSSVHLTGEPFGAFSAQMFDSSGNAVGNPMLVSGGARGWTFAGVLLPDGNVALVFQPINGTGPGEIFTSVLDNTSEPADAVHGTSGDDTYAGTPGLDTAIVAAPLASVQAYSFPEGNLMLTTSAGTDTFPGIERVKLADALFALDTHGPGDHTWEVAALFRAGLGALPGMHELSMWTSAADHSPSMGVLAQQMIDYYAPGVSTATLVTNLYVQLMHATPSPETVQTFVDQVGPGHTFETQGDLLIFAAHLSLNAAQLVGFTGTAQPLDPAFF